MTTSIEKAGKATVEVCDGAVPVITLAGEVNYESSPSICGAVDRLVAQGCRVVSVRCPDASFIDSSGIGALVNCAQKLESLSGNLKLLEVTKQLRHALDVSGFVSLFDLEDTLTSTSQESPRTISRMWQSTSFSIPASADLDGTIRHRITDLARSMPFSEEDVEDIQLAVGEAVANAYRHGIKDHDHERISVRCVGDETALTVEITNPGPVFDPDTVPPPDPLNPREGGMGIFFMRRCMDSVEFIFSEAGTTVKMIKLLRNHGGGIVDIHDNGNQ